MSSKCLYSDKFYCYSGIFIIDGKIIKNKYDNNYSEIKTEEQLNKIVNNYECVGIQNDDLITIYCRSENSQQFINIINYLNELDYSYKDKIKIIIKK